MQKLYAAPMEGLTGYVWRRAHRLVFGGADRYFSPFIVANGSERLQTKELRDVTQGETDLVPQILTNRGDYFISTAKKLQSIGYQEVNYNLGCPSGTVVSKHKGSGMLEDLKTLDMVLDEIFSALPDLRISIKTRIGLVDEEEWPALLRVYEQYPIYELIVHPRLQRQMYTGRANREIFKKTQEFTALPLIYNGDIETSADEALSFACGVMVGRGLIAHPALLRELRGGDGAAREELVRFHELLLEGYGEYMSGDVPILHRMKEFWYYFADSFEGTERAMKSLRKAKTMSEYKAETQNIFHSCPLRGNH